MALRANCPTDTKQFKKRSVYTHATVLIITRNCNSYNINNVSRTINEIKIL